MKKKRFALIVIFLISVVIAPFALVFGFAFGMPCQYQETYLAALADKYELLKKTNEKKIIIIGGSSVPFGLNSELVEQHLPYKVVDFGLYASLGTKVMLDLAKVNINEGDIIVIAPEVHPQLMSLHFDPLIMLQCLDSSWEMFNNLTYQDKQKVLASVPTFSGEKYQYFSKEK